LRWPLLGSERSAAWRSRSVRTLPPGALLRYPEPLTLPGCCLFASCEFLVLKLMARFASNRKGLACGLAVENQWISSVATSIRSGCVHGALPRSETRCNFPGNQTSVSAAIVAEVGSGAPLRSSALFFANSLTGVRCLDHALNR